MCKLDPTPFPTLFSWAEGKALIGVITPILIAIRMIGFVSLTSYDWPRETPPLF